MSVEPPHCAFCEIVAGHAPAHVVDEDELSLALLDIQPFAEGHCLVISKRHEPWWNDLTDPETSSLFAMAKRVFNAMERAQETSEELMKWRTAEALRAAWEKI